MNNDQIKTFIQGGKATFTLESLKTQKHYTFHATKVVPKNSDLDALIFIALLVGPDHYEYLGTIFVNDGELTYRETAKSMTNPKLHAVMKFFITGLTKGIDFERHSLVFRHEGKCCVCSRPLTTPKSIDAGIGPVCAGGV